MGRQIIFIHSAGPQGVHEGSSDLVEYLRKELNNGYTLRDPRMPEPENPRYSAWKEKLGRELVTLAEDQILVGHSLGGSVLLKYLSEEPFQKRIAGLFLVAAAHWGSRDWDIEEYVMRKDFSSVLNFIPRIFLYHSRDDEWVPFEHMTYFAKKLPRAIVRALNGRGHEFNSGLPELVEDIKSLNYD